MLREGMTKLDAAHEWVREFNAIPYGMIEKLMCNNPEEWWEVTKPSLCDRVYVYEVPDNATNEGEIISYDEDSELYCIELDEGGEVSADESDFEVKRYEQLPMWGTLWTFGDKCDDWWLEEDNGIRVMSDCGFRIYEHEEFGYFFGIDGCGYNFYEAHWLPLYNKRGLHWHDEKAEKKYQMIKKGYEIKTYCGRKCWFNGSDYIEECDF